MYYCKISMYFILVVYTCIYPWVFLYIIYKSIVFTVFYPMKIQ